MVDVPIDDRDPLDPVAGLSLADGDRDVVEEAEAHHGVGGRVMAGRADEREAVVGGAVEHRVDDRQRSARRQRRGLPALRPDPRLGPDPDVLAAGAGGCELVDHPGGVGELELSARRGARRERRQLSRDP